ncbi:CLUMA_CG006023, isoform A [Clunio marinus]|uniref:CLUMA_CG006023, isoform A n=1 Tax=Clunio marinus TaxID=568069 RepID=A0A1J1HWR9_9DIPT|nr:CLUMA_CG006023, isoform A [Clunio marinus]
MNFQVYISLNIPNLCCSMVLIGQITLHLFWINVELRMVNKRVNIFIITIAFIQCSQTNIHQHEG